MSIDMTGIDEIGSKGRPLRVAIIGSGPGGFFAAQALLDLEREGFASEIDVFERLPTPYGLVRGGVAPDHQSIKAVTRVYERSARRENFRFLGNVTVGRDIQVAELRAHYDQIVYAVGNEASRRLGIPGEGLWRCTPAAVLVGWYNGHPDYREVRPDLSVTRVAVVGNGNVAIDVARILARSPQELGQTDIADHALAALAASRVQEIVVLGRRGPLQAAFTPGELKELSSLELADTIVGPEGVELDPESAGDLQGASVQTRRNIELLRSIAARGTGDRPRRIQLRFLVSPVEILGDDNERVRALRLQHNRLERAPDGRLRAVPTDHYEELPVGMVVPAIGFEGLPLPGVPFDRQRGLIRNVEGRVVAGDPPAAVPCQYVVGWARSGASGLIGSHKAASRAVVALMREDLATAVVARRPLPPRQKVLDLLEQRDVRVVSFDDWLVLDRIEVARGVRRGEAPREKFTRVDEMLDAVDQEK